MWSRKFLAIMEFGSSSICSQNSAIHLILKKGLVIQLLVVFLISMLNCYTVLQISMNSWA
jgi:hypothetical protein